MMNRLTNSIYLNDAKKTQVYKDDLKPPYFLKKSKPKKETLQQTAAPTTPPKTEVRKTEQPKTKVKSRLDILIEEHPKHEALIRKEFRTIGVSYDDIESIILMEDAAQAAREAG